MELNEIKKHWEDWSNEFKTNLRATTKTSTIKQLEINALFRAIQKTSCFNNNDVELLEVGCGNGYNCIALAEKMQHASFTGVDFISDMVDNAKKNINEQDRISFHVGNILELESNKNLQSTYDIVFTDRCIINLNSTDLQFQAIDQLSTKLKKDGYLIILENFIQSFKKQNDCREVVGLPRRKPAEFNLFMDSDCFQSYLNRTMDLIHVDDFGSLHDIVLYVLVPMINDGTIDYNHPLVSAATALSISLSEKYENPFGTFGQNRLYLYCKR